MPSPLSMPARIAFYLNVATPSVENGDINQNKSLAVMVWIHGGGWVGGSYDPIIFNPDFSWIMMLSL